MEATAALGRYLGYALGAVTATVVWLLLGSEPAHAADEPRPLSDLTSQLVADVEGTTQPAVAAVSSAVRRTTAATPLTRPLRQPVEAVLAGVEQATATTTERVVASVARTEAALTAVRPTKQTEAVEPGAAPDPAPVAADSARPADRPDRTARPKTAARAEQPTDSAPALRQSASQPTERLAAPSADAAVDRADRAQAAPQPVPPTAPVGQSSQSAPATSSVPTGPGLAVLPTSISTPADHGAAAVLVHHRLPAGTNGPLPGHTPD